MAAALAYVESIAAAIQECRQSVTTLAEDQSRQAGGKDAHDGDQVESALDNFKEKFNVLQTDVETQQKTSAVQRKLSFVDTTLKRLRSEIETIQDLALDAETLRREKSELVAEHTANVQWLEKELEQSSQQVTELSDKLWLQAEHEELIRQLQHQTSHAQELQQAMVENARVASTASLQGNSTSVDRSVEGSKAAGVQTDLQVLDRLLKQKDKELELEREKAKGIRSSIHERSIDSSSQISGLKTNLLSAQKGFAKYFELYKGVDEELKMARDRQDVDSRCLGQLWAINEKLKTDIAALEEKVWMEKRMREMLGERISELENLLGQGEEDTPNQVPFQHAEAVHRHREEKDTGGASASEAASAPSASAPSASAPSASAQPDGGRLQEVAPINGKLSPKRWTSPRTELAKTLAGYQEMLSSRDKQVVDLQRQVKTISEARQAEQEAVVQHMKCEDDDKRQLRSELNNERILRSKAEREVMALQFEMRNVQQQLAVRHSMARTNHSPTTFPASDSPASSHPALPEPASPVESLFSGLIGFLSPSPRRRESKQNSSIPTATIESPRGQPSSALNNFSSSPSSPSKQAQQRAIQAMSSPGMYSMPSSPCHPPLETIAERDHEASPREDDASPSQSPRDVEIKVGNTDQGSLNVNGLRAGEAILFEFDHEQQRQLSSGQRQPANKQGEGSASDGGQVYMIRSPQHSSLQSQAHSDCRAAEAAGYGDPSSPEWRITL